MTQISNLPILHKVEVVGVPTKRLNTVQHKNYRDYADKVSESIKSMLKDISEKVLSVQRVENRDKIVDRLAKELGVASVFNEMKALRRDIEKVNKESMATARKFDMQISKLDAEKDSAIAKLKIEKMQPLLEEFGKHRDGITKGEKLKIPYYNYPKIKTVKEYDKDKEGDEDDAPSVSLTYPAINLIDFISETIKESDFIPAEAIQVELDKVMRPIENEFYVARLKLQSMEQSVKEVMMFDEDRINEAFEKLFRFRDSIQEKYIEVVKGINPSELTKEEVTGD